MFQVVLLNPNPPFFLIRVKINLAVAPRRSEAMPVEVVTFNMTDPSSEVVSLTPLVASSISLTYKEQLPGC